MYPVSEPISDKAPASPPKTLVVPLGIEGVTMKIIAKVIESMLCKDTTQKWNGQTSAFEPNNVWHWNP